MRLAAVVLSVLCVAIPLEATAAPRRKIAVAPLKGDDGKVADAVVDALAGKDFAVIGPKETRSGMAKLALSDDDELDRKATRKLASWLGVVAVIDGTVGKSRGKRTLHLEVH